MRIKNKIIHGKFSPIAFLILDATKIDIETLSVRHPHDLHLFKPSWA